MQSLFLMAGESFAKGEVMESSSYASDPGSATVKLPAPSNTIESGTERSTVYRCKKCRRVVARDENVIGHDVGGGESAFKWQKRGGKEGMYTQAPVCTSMFVEPMQWMTAGLLSLHFRYHLVYCYPTSASSDGIRAGQELAKKRLIKHF